MKKITSILVPAFTFFLAAYCLKATITSIKLSKTYYTCGISGIVTHYNNQDKVTINGTQFTLKDNLLLNTNITVQEGNYVTVYHWKDYNFVGEVGLNIDKMVYKKSQSIGNYIACAVGTLFFLILFVVVLQEEIAKYKNDEDSS